MQEDKFLFTTVYYGYKSNNCNITSRVKAILYFLNRGNTAWSTK